MSGIRRNFGQWKVLLICPDPGLKAQMEALLAELLLFSPVISLDEYPTRAVLEEVLNSHGVSLCFVDATSREEWALALLSDLSLLNPKLPVVALHAANQPELILKTLRQGATEFLCAPLTEDQFCTVMERIASVHRARGGSDARVVCFMPVKGASGASTLACNVAWHWRKLSQAKVVLADLDPLAGTVAFQSKVKQSYSFLDALSRAGELDEDIWKGLVSPKSGVDVLAAPEQPVHGIHDETNPAGLIQFMRSIYGVVLVDTGGPFGHWNLSLARLCDDLVLVTTNELPSLHAAQRALAYLETHRVEPSRVRLVINRFRKEIGLQKELVESALQMEVFHVVPNSQEDLQHAVVEGKPVPVNSPAGKGFLQVAEKLVGRSSEDAEPQPKPGGGALSGIFSLFGRK